MNAIENLVAERSAAPQPASGPMLLARVFHYVLCIVGAAVLFVAYEHLKLNEQSTPSLVSLAAASLLALVPIRALLREVFAIERGVLHLVHGLGGLVLIALPVSGMVSGAPMLTHAAMAPFAIMGAAQAVMHQQYPRNARQAEALRRFATSLPEVEQFTKPRDFASPANLARAIAVLSDLLSKAQVLGETELESDPGFQSALKGATTRLGLRLSLDAIDHSLDVMGENPLAATAVPALRNRLAEVRRTVAKHQRAALR
jgi:hypothetical protein